MKEIKPLENPSSDDYLDFYLVQLMLQALFLPFNILKTSLCQYFVLIYAHYVYSGIDL